MNADESAAATSSSFWILILIRFNSIQRADLPAGRQVRAPDAGPPKKRPSNPRSPEREGASAPGPEALGAHNQTGRPVGADRRHLWPLLGEASAGRRR